MKGRYFMKKIAVIFPKAPSDIEKRALEELNSILLLYSDEAPVFISCAENFDKDSYRCIYVGTKSDNPYVDKMSVSKLTAPESYAICVKDDSAIIEGFDGAGVLYGVLDFYNKYLVNAERSLTVEIPENPLEKEVLPGFFALSAPSVRERGLWTWGHVIYDYRGYLNNMMRLKMNSVIIWNDFVPLNAKEIVDYAHARNIKVYWGFSWLWDTSFENANIKNLDGEAEKILSKYESEYLDSGGDGIYFQTFTELKRDNIGGVIIAEAASEFVNETASLFYKKYPELEIMFGLHATSVKEKLSFISKVDSRIRIVWEDMGAFPFAYSSMDIEDYDQTLDLVNKTATLRGKSDRFGVVTKGFTKLDWSKFVHLEASQIIGEATAEEKAAVAVRKREEWRHVQAGWITNADKAHNMIAEIYNLKDGDFSAFALVEDGLFDENIMYPVALYSEILWDTKSTTKEIMRAVALRKYVTFV